MIPYSEFKLHYSAYMIVAHVICVGQNVTNVYLSTMDRDCVYVHEVNCMNINSL